MMTMVMMMILKYLIICILKSSARILRGLRIAARLGLQFSKETAKAMQDLSPSIMSLDKSRLMMELNSMLAYGAAESSLCLLHRFKLLEITLPIQGAYLANRDQSARSSIMLMKLFSSMDKLVACDRPAGCILWVALLAFHLALLNHPQDALVVWTFSSILYYGNWMEAAEVAREKAQFGVQFIPEISETCESKSDESLLEEVSDLASLVKSSVGALTSTSTLTEAMARYPTFPCSGLVLVSEKMGNTVSELFEVLETNIKSYDSKRKSLDIDYRRLGKGEKRETRFVLGKIIMDAMSSGMKPSRPLSELFG